LPGALPTGISGSGRDTVTAEYQELAFFAPILDGNKLAGFGTEACLNGDGAITLALVDASPIRGAVNDPERHTNTVGPAPVPSGGPMRFTPDQCA
ncbi:MAG: hypothetical protein ACRD0U_13580, partial [Acidimicrobiales bacterium]